MKEGRHSKYPYYAVRTCESCKVEENVLILNYDQTRAYHFCSDLCRHEKRAASCRGNRRNRKDTPLKYKKNATRGSRAAYQPRKPKEKAACVPRSQRDVEYIRQLRMSKGLPEVRA